MEVILLERVGKLGNIGDVAIVRDGYGRNFLLPRKKALRATKQNKEFFAQKRQEIEEQNKALIAEANKIVPNFDGAFVVIIRQAAEDGRLYGSVTSKDIADGSKSVSNIDKNQVVLDKPVKSIGVHVIKIALHSEVIVNLNVIVARSDDDATQLKRDFLAPKSQEEVTLDTNPDAVNKTPVTESADKNNTANQDKKGKKKSDKKPKAS